MIKYNLITNKNKANGFCFSLPNFEELSCWIGYQILFQYKISHAKVKAVAPGVQLKQKYRVKIFTIKTTCKGFHFLAMKLPWNYTPSQSKLESFRNKTAMQLLLWKFKQQFSGLKENTVRTSIQYKYRQSNSKSCNTSSVQT